MSLYKQTEKTDKLSQCKRIPKKAHDNSTREKNKRESQAWWNTPVIPALRR
jgi:hypothetical protein